MRASTRAFVLAACVAVGSSAAHATTISYAAGSLIIPSTAAYQDSCGAVSVYGLIYDVLRANAWLAANGYTAITVHYAYNNAKTSPDRCVPTNLDTPPTSTSDPLPTSSDAVWNDGCDFQVIGAGSTPVTLVSNATAATASTDGTVTTFNNTSNAQVYPQYASRTVTHAAGVTTVGYLGGPFIISQSDAATFTGLLQGTINAQDSSGNTIDFSPFRSNKGSCTYGTTHYVNVHRAAVAFNAPAGKDFTAPPPRLALLDSDSATKTRLIASGILEGYLKNAGLDFSGAQGCPTGGADVTDSTLCPSGATQGQIFDVFDIKDLANNLMANVDATGARQYQMVWMPHWETQTTTTQTPNTTETAALTNLNTFLDQPGGVMAECASIASIEGAYVHHTEATTCHITNSQDLTNYSSCATRAGPIQLQTCVDDGTGSCSATTTPWGIDRDAKGFGISSSYVYAALKNCSDPTMASGSTCAYYAYPGDPYSQTGDYLWNKGTNSTFGDGIGTVSDFLPNPYTNSIYKPGVVPLVSAVASLNSSKLDTVADARSMVAADLVTRSVKDNTAGKGNILYLGGHDLTSSVPGTKVVLQTLLQLGTDTAPTAGTTYELSRAAPIATTIGPTAATAVPSIVQGTYDYVYPVPNRTTVSLAADVPYFTFPFYKGHLRVRATTAVTTTASNFSSGTDIFSTPTVVYGGCNRPYNLSCRNIFIDRPGTGTTTSNTDGTQVTVSPTMLEVNDTNADQIGVLLVPGMAHAQFLTMTERLLAGAKAITGSGYVAELGGVDRSSVAVIPSSDYDGGTRPTMIYFGATDGMLHAVCGETTTAPVATCTYGEELWAFLPRVQLPFVKSNTTRIDGSPHVTDMYGTFPACGGGKCFRTILTFQTGSGDVGTAGQTPAVYALDVTDPTQPTVIWDYTVPTPSSAGSLALGVGETVGAGVTLSNGFPVPMVYAETNNGGTGGSGVVLTAIRADTGAEQFSVGYAYPLPGATGSRTGSSTDSSVPATGVPGGAVTVSKTDDGYITDVVFADLYGDIWEVDPLTGASRTGTASPLSTPLFSFTTDYQPIGPSPAIYSNGSTLYAAVASGGYDDPTDSTWGAASNYWAAAVRLTPTGAVTYPLNETTAGPNVYSFQTNGRAYAQPTVSGGQLLVVTDSGDVNQVTYGTTGSNTGTLYQSGISAGGLSNPTTVVIATGGSSVAADASGVYESSGQTQEKVSTAAPNPPPNQIKMERLLWLRTE